MSDPERELLDEQIAYYRARAAEYDATSQPPGDPFAAHGAAMVAAVERLDLLAEVFALGRPDEQMVGERDERRAIGARCVHVWIAIVRHAGPRSRNVGIRWDMRGAIDILGAAGVTGGRGANGYSVAATATVARPSASTPSP